MGHDERCAGRILRMSVDTAHQLTWCPHNLEEIGMYPTRAKYADIGVALSTGVLFASIVLLEVLNCRSGHILPVPNGGKLREASTRNLERSQRRQIKLLEEEILRADEESVRTAIIAERTVLSQEYKENLATTRAIVQLRSAVMWHIAFFCLCLPGVFITIVYRVGGYGCLPMGIVIPLLIAGTGAIIGAVYQVIALNVFSAIFGN